MEKFASFTVSIFIFSFLIFGLSNVSYAGIGMIPSCPCDTAILGNGVNGNEIVEALCPNGLLGPDSEELNNNEELTLFGIAKKLDSPPILSYITGTDNLSMNFCEINVDGEEPVNLPISVQELEMCNERLRAGCGLSLRPPSNVPTLSEWGLLVLGVTLGLISLFVFRKRKQSTY